MIDRRKGAALEKAIRSRMVLKERDRGLERWSTPGRDYWAPAGQSNGIAVVLAQEELQVYRRLVRKGDVVIDGGAAVGAYTREALDSGAALVVAVEPVSENIECLRRNFREEIAQGRVIVYPKGLWDRDDVLVMHSKDRNFLAGTFLAGQQSAEVGRFPLTSLDKMVEELNLPRIDVIKLDIEGAEAKALLGGRRSLARWKPRMALCVYHLEDDYRTLPELALRLQPAYTSEMDHCALSDTLEIVPEVQIFQ